MSPKILIPISFLPIKSFLLHSDLFLKSQRFSRSPFLQIKYLHSSINLTFCHKLSSFIHNKLHLLKKCSSFFFFIKTRQLTTILIFTHTFPLRNSLKLLFFFFFLFLFFLLEESFIFLVFVLLVAFHDNSED